MYHPCLEIKNYVIQTLHVDDEGYIYFNIAKPFITLTDIDHFAISLNYYRKNLPYYLQVEAIAHIIPDAGDYMMIDEYGNLRSNNNCVKIKAKILQVNYVEEQKPKKFFEQLKQEFIKISKSIATFFY
jgi:hypothetical protein